jgi:hypothetical protein
MTTSIKIRTNGNYVAEAKNSGGTIIGKSGPGNNVESEWIGVPHGGFNVTERNATAEEIEAANKPADGEQKAE